MHNLKPEHAALLLFTLLFVMMLANVIVNHLTFPTLRFLEGYGWGQTLRRFVVEIVDKRYYAPRASEFHQLGNPAKLPPDQRAR